MSILDYVYQTVILPIELLVEVIYVLMLRLFHSKGIALVMVSVVVSTLLLPLQRVSDRFQLKEQKKQASMDRWTRHIKDTFTGDERYMMLSAYYKEQHYHPIYALRGIIPLLIQIPFFIAAYHFISTLQSLNGASLWGISDLSLPDGLLSINHHSINLLPVIMTILNVVSSVIYSAKNNIKTTYPLYASAIIFFVLLYNSPSGLVLYWASNNLYSAIKNAIQKSPDNNTVSGAIDKPALRVFIPSMLYLATLIGGVVPALLVSASPAEFIFLQYYEHPLSYILTTFLPIFGAALLWGGFFFLMSGIRIQRFLSGLAAVLCFIITVNALFFGKVSSSISPDLRYGQELSFPLSEIIVNILVISVITICVLFLYSKFKTYLAHIILILLISCIGVAGFYSVQIYRAVASYDFIDEYNPQEAMNIKPLATLSSTGPNVIVIMLDRAVGGYYPFIFNEKPELKNAFDGFVLFPNTISYANATKVGAVSVFGGYEYNPVGINHRSETTIVDKQNEALCLIPRIFSDLQYDVTIFDPPYAGFEEIPDLTIYDDYPGIKAYITMGKYTDEYILEHTKRYASRRHRNMIFYSLFRVAPTVLKPAIYDDEDWLSADVAINVHADFRKSHPVLNRLSEFFTIEDSSTGSFLMMANEVTHGPSNLQLPKYEPSFEVDNSEFNTTSRMDGNGNTLYFKDSFDFTTYCSNMSAMLSLAKFFDYLRENGLYDNTRIILTSDHGANVTLYPDVSVTNPASFNALLMIKDFNSTGFEISDRFMTVADTPSLALEGLVQHPINPFTGSNINTAAKTSSTFQKVFYSGDIDPHATQYANLKVLYVHNDIHKWSGPVIE